MVGREPEQRQLAAFVAAALSGTLQVAGVEGPRGIGKTALVEDTLSRLEGWTIFRAHAVVPAAPCFVIRELCTPLGWGDCAPGDSPEAIATWMCEQIASLGGPVSLAVDEATDMDEESAMVLRHLVRQGAALPVLVLVSALPGDAAGLVDLARQPGRGGWLQLAPLRRRGVRELFAQRLNVMVDSLTLRRILDATDGYPCELEELLGRLVSSDDPWLNLSSALTIARQQPPDRQLADRVRDALRSVNRSARAAALAISLAPLTWEDACRVIEGRGLPMPQRADVFELGLFATTSVGTLRASQHRVAQAVIDEADPGELQETHLALSQVLDGTPALLHRALAAHESTDDPGLAKELSARSLHHFLLGEAENCFELAYASARLEPSRVMAAALAAMRTHRPDLLSTLEPLIALEGRLLRRHALAALLSVVRQELDDAADELARVDPAECDDPTLVVLAYAQGELLRMQACGGEHAVATTLGPAIRLELVQRRQSAVESGTPPEFLSELSTLIVLLDLWSSLVEVDPADSASIIGLVTELERQLKPWPGTERGWLVLRVLRCAHLYVRGQYDKSAAELAALADTPFDDPDMLLQWANVRFHLLFQSASWDEAVKVGQHALGRTLDRLNDPGRLQVAEIVLRVSACREESPPELDITSPSLGRVEPAPVQAVRDLNAVWRWVAHGGDATMAARLADQCWHSRTGGVQGIPRTTALLRVRAHVAAGNRVAAHAAYDELRDVGLEAGIRSYVTAHSRALLTSDPEVAQAQFIAADQALTSHLTQQPGHGLRLFRAVLAEDWAEYALVAPNPLAPRLFDCMVDALGVLRVAGAGPWRDRLVELSAQMNGRAKDGPHLLTQMPHEDTELMDQLTTREREIAWLVTDGLTNREIAGVLSISVRTVEFHISNALGKLDLASRVELRTQLRRTPREL